MCSCVGRGIEENPARRSEEGSCRGWAVGRGVRASQYSLSIQ